MYSIYSAFSKNGAFIRSGKFVSLSNCSKNAALKTFDGSVEIKIECHVSNVAEAMFKVKEITAQMRAAPTAKSEIKHITMPAPNVRRAKATFI